MSGFVKLTTRVKRINAQILAAERRYGKDSKIVKRIYHYLNLAQGTEGLTRYRTPKGNVSLQQIAKFDRALARAENSAYLSKAGREEMQRRARETFIGHLQEEEKYANVSDKELANLYDAFLSVKGAVDEITKQDSNQVVSDIAIAMAKGLSKKQVVNLAKKYEKKRKNPNGIDYTLADYIRSLGKIDK